jgi:hypothetical protein
MDGPIRVGERVRLLLKVDRRSDEGWFEGTVVRVEPYSQHRSFHWVELDPEAQELLGIQLISVLNPKKIQRI